MADPLPFAAAASPPLNANIRAPIKATLRRILFMSSFLTHLQFENKDHFETKTNSKPLLTRVGPLRHDLEDNSRIFARRYARRPIDGSRGIHSQANVRPDPVGATTEWMQANVDPGT